MTYEFIPQFCKMLANLGVLLEKAQAFADGKKFDSTNLVASRLAPDQFAFAFQVQAACDTAKNYAFRLTGKEAPKHEDKEKTFPELQQRLLSTIEYLQTIEEKDFQGWESRKILNPRREGKFLPSDEFAMQHAIPNFYFHVTTAYSILRHNGVDIGKKDFLGPINYRDL